MSIIRRLLLHMCVVISFVCIAAKVLDWFNPFMDFSGHMVIMQMILYMMVPLMVFTRTKTRRKRP